MSADGNLHNSVSLFLCRTIGTDEDYEPLVRPCTVNRRGNDSSDCHPGQSDRGEYVFVGKKYEKKSPQILCRSVVLRIKITLDTEGAFHFIIHIHMRSSNHSPVRPVTAWCGKAKKRLSDRA